MCSRLRLKSKNLPDTCFDQSVLSMCLTSHITSLIYARNYCKLPFRTIPCRWSCSSPYHDEFLLRNDAKFNNKGSDIAEAIFEKLDIVSLIRLD